MHAKNGNPAYTPKKRIAYRHGVAEAHGSDMYVTEPADVASDGNREAMNRGLRAKNGNPAYTPKKRKAYRHGVAEAHGSDMYFTELAEVTADGNREAMAAESGRGSLGEKTRRSELADPRQQRIGDSIVEVPGDGWCFFHAVGRYSTQEPGWAKLRAAEIYLQALEWLLQARTGPRADEVVIACTPENELELQKHKECVAKHTGSFGSSAWTDADILLWSKVLAVLTKPNVLDSIHHGSVVEIWALTQAFDFECLVWDPRENQNVWIRTMEQISDEAARHKLATHPNMLEIVHRDLGITGHYDMVRGDGLGALAGGKPSSWKALGKVGSTSLVHACFNTVAQGDHLGVEFATASHRNLLKDRGLLVPEEEIVSNRPYGGSEVLQGLVIDDFFSVSVERAESDNLRSRSKRRFDVAKQTYAKEGLMGSPLKDIVGQQKAKIAGAEVDSSDDALKLGIVPLGSPVAKRLALALVSLEVTRLRYTTNSLHACLLGGWTSALMFRRPLMSVLFASHKLIDTSALNASRPRVVTLPRGSAQELLLLAVLAPAMCSDLSIPFSEKLFCTDSSEAKGAVVSTTVSPDLSRYLWKVGSKKGGYARLLTREEALLRRLSLYDGSEEFSSGDLQVGFEKPRKSPLLRFDFIELCGGASKVSAELSKLGWVVGPCLDLDSSAHFDLSSLDLWRWVVYLLEAGLLDGFMVQPPCTTFSPAQHPALRSYELPRGFCPCEARTLLGTCLALRSLSLMMVAARIGAIGLLEQSRRSKMAWLPEWRRLLGEGWAHEEWCASCMYGSPHQKEFRFLVTNLESAELHRKCDGQHSHIKIEGKYTKASAIYTDQLAQSLAACISKGLRRKKAVAAYHLTQDSGLESIVMNDLLLSSTWRVEDQWHWKSPAHINIHESAAVLRLLKTQAISFPRSRFAVGVDSHVALSALAKGRSPSYGLRPVLRRSACLCVAGCLYPSFSFAPTRMNPADCPTRDVCFPDPVREGFAKHLDSASLLVLAPVSGLRRFLSNWARLVLVLLQGRLCSWTWGDSRRFSHYSKSAYPYGWSCSRKTQLMDFDATLGFPGEGPLWVCRFCLLLFSSSVSCFLPSSFGRLCLSLSLSFTHSGEPQGTFLAAAAPPAVSHGVLEPR